MRGPKHEIIALTREGVSCASGGKAINPPASARRSQKTWSHAHNSHNTNAPPSRFSGAAISPRQAMVGLNTRHRHPSRVCRCRAPLCLGLSIRQYNHPKPPHARPREPASTRAPWIRRRPRPTTLLPPPPPTEPAPSSPPSADSRGAFLDSPPSPRPRKTPRLCPAAAAGGPADSPATPPWG